MHESSAGGPENREGRCSTAMLDRLPGLSGMPHAAKAPAAIASAVIRENFARAREHEQREDGNFNAL